MKLNHLQKRIHWKQLGWLFLALFCVLAALVISLLDRATAPPMPEDDVTELSEGWTYLPPAGGSRQLTSLHENLNVPAGETVHIENTLPADVQEDIFLCFRSAQQSVRVSVDGQPIYEYDASDSRLFSRATPSAWNFVPVPVAAAGKNIAIETVSPYRQTSGQLNPVFYGPYSVVELHILNMQLPQFIISMAMIVLAIILFLISFWLIKSKEMRHILHSLSLFILLIGVWVFGESKMPHTFSFFNLMESSIVFYTLFLLPLPYLDYMRSRLNSRHKKALSVLFYAALINTAVCTLLQLFRVTDLIELLPAAHVIIILTAGYTVYALISDRRKAAEKRDWLELCGLIVLLLCVAAELGLYYRNDFFNIGMLVPFGLLTYLLLLSLSTVRALMRPAAEAVELERKLQESRVRLLISQIQPHFIYNTLGAIQAYIMKSPNTAYKMVQDFSDYLRANIQSLTNAEPISFTADLKHARAYTDIELIRFRNRIQVIYEIGPTDFSVLPLTVQPLVENAIKHGLCKKMEGGTVWIRTTESERDYIVTVEDNGTGFDVETLKENPESVGLLNIQKRLKLQLDADVEIVSVPEHGTHVTIRIPKTKKNPA